MGGPPNIQRIGGGLRLKASFLWLKPSAIRKNGNAWHLHKHEICEPIFLVEILHKLHLKLALPSDHLMRFCHPFWPKAQIYSSGERPPKYGEEIADVCMHVDSIDWGIICLPQPLFLYYEICNMNFCVTQSKSAWLRRMIFLPFSGCIIREATQFLTTN